MRGKLPELHSLQTMSPLPRHRPLSQTQGSVNELNYGPASKYYDLFATKDDLAFFKEIALKHGKKALELGVGTGRVAIELAKAKITVLGIDNSRFMLDVAKEKVKKESPSLKKRIELKLGDMRTFKTNRSFPFVYIASSTFEHCKTKEDQRKCLSNVYRSLQSGGVFTFDISQSHKKLESSWWIDQAQLGNQEIVRTIFSKTDLETNIVSVELFFDVYERGKLKERYYEHGEARLSTKEEIEAMLIDIGFMIEEIFGDFSKSAYSPQSRHAVFVCRKA